MNDMVPEESSAGAAEQEAAPEPGAAPAPASAPAGPSDGSQGKRYRLRRTRGIVAWVLVVLASLLIPISVIAAWAINTVTNTDQYVATMAPLATNPVIVQHLATKSTDLLFSSHVVQNEIESVLPKKAKPIVQPITNQVKGYTEQLALRVFESKQFSQLWNLLNRRSHTTVVNILTGKYSKQAQALQKYGAVVLNLTPQLNQLIDQADSRGVTLFDPLKSVLDKNGLSFTVVTRSQISQFSGVFNLVVKLRWVIPAVALVVGILSIVVATKRRKTLLRASAGVALFTLVLLGVLTYARGVFLNKAGAHVDPNVVGAVWDTLLRFLKTSLRWTVLAGVVVAFFAWVFGPARYAVWIRATSAKGGRWVAAQTSALRSRTGQAAAESERTRRVGGWILEHLNGLRIVGVIVAALVLLFGGNFSGWGLLIIVIVLAVYLGLLQLVAAWAKKVASSAAASHPA